MSVIDNNTIDAMALTEDNKGIALLITDHLDWSDEYKHLITLQEKINTYVAFLEEKQYEDTYKNTTITYGIIEIHFLYEITSNAEKFLQSIQDQAGELGIRIECYISSGDTDEA